MNDVSPTTDTTILLCPSCGQEATPGTRFCTACGATLGVAPIVVANRPTDSGARLGWWLSGALMLTLIGAVLVSRETAEIPLTTQAATQPPLGTSELDLTSMTPREAADRLFDRVMLHYTSTNFVEALTTAKSALESSSTHLLNLSLAANAAAAMGQTDVAVSYHQALLDAYDTELEKALPEYELHRDILQQMKDGARSYLDSL